MNLAKKLITPKKIINNLSKVNFCKIKGTFENCSDCKKEYCKQKNNERINVIADKWRYV